MVVANCKPTTPREDGHHQRARSHIVHGRVGCRARFPGGWCYAVVRRRGFAVLGVGWAAGYYSSVSIFEFARSSLPSLDCPQVRGGRGGGEPAKQHSDSFSVPAS